MITHTGVIGHSSPILTGQSAFTDRKQSLRFDMVIFLRWNEVSCPSPYGTLSIHRHEVLNATGICNMRIC
jgi:hypothetical protein